MIRVTLFSLGGGQEKMLQVCGWQRVFVVDVSGVLIKVHDVLNNLNSFITVAHGD